MQVTYPYYMRFFPRILVILVFCCSSFILSAQTNYAEAIARFVEDHNARVSMRNWVKTETAPVSIRLNERNELEAFIDNENKLRITLQREEDTDMDELFPYNIDSALIVMTNETVVIIDPVEKIHFAFLKALGLRAIGIINYVKRIRLLIHQREIPVKPDGQAMCRVQGRMLKVVCHFFLNPMFYLV